MSLNALASEIAEINLANGWMTERAFGDDIALIHSEVSEAYEEYRNGRQPAERYYRGSNGLTWLYVPEYGAPDALAGKPEGIPSELADIVIRVLDTAHRYGIDLDDVVAEKLAHNRTRGYRHGSKVV